MPIYITQRRRLQTFSKCFTPILSILKNHLYQLGYVNWYFDSARIEWSLFNRMYISNSFWKREKGFIFEANGEKWIV